MRVVIGQPALFPWIGTFEKVRACDIYVHYDDVQFSKGDFTNRARIRTAEGCTWLTVPLRNVHLGQEIRQVAIDESQPWRDRHLAHLAQQYRRAPFRREMLDLVEYVYAGTSSRVAGLAIASVEAVCDYFDLHPAAGFVCSSDLAIPGRKTERILAIVRSLAGTTYVCGAGKQAVRQRYLDHELLESAGVRVEYMQYRNAPYRQLHGSFVPGTSILDLIACEGVAGKAIIASSSVHWRELA